MISPVERAATVLRGGGLVAIPTETVYGLAAWARHEAALERLFAVKGRPRQHPVIVHLASGEQLADWAREVPEEARQLAQAFWPGPLTLLLKRRPEVLNAITGGLDTVGLRVPAASLTRQLIESLGDGIAAPSANRFGRVSPTTAAHVRRDLGTDVDEILDGGACAVGIESTIVDLTAGPPRVLRPGAITTELIGACLGVEPVPSSATGAVRAPGMHPSHYAPRARVELRGEDDWEAHCRHLLAGGCRVGVLLPQAPPRYPEGVVMLGALASSDAFARLLYVRLREADEAGLDVLLVVPPEGDGLAAAVRDRLHRAAAPAPRSGPPGSNSGA